MDLLLEDAFRLPLAQLPRVLFHALLLTTIIASFWILDSVKDPILNATIGIEYQPAAKVVSVFSTFAFVCIYDALTSIVTKSTLFYIISMYFGTLFFILAALFSHPTLGLNNTDKDSTRLIGWITFISIECYGSLLVALFWSFTNTVMDMYLAKASYGLIISAAQIGAILGSSVATHSSSIGIPTLLLYGSIFTLSVNLLIKLYTINFASAMTTIEMHETSTVWSFRSLYEGFRLIFKYKYVCYLLGITMIYETMLTMIEYKFKILGAGNSTGSSEGDTDTFVLLLGRFGQFTNIISFIISLFCFSLLISKFGIRICLFVFPLLLTLGMMTVAVTSQLGIVFIVVSILKAIVFSFFDPLKEILYVPTSDAIKFKAASWIEVFGARLAKAMGSFLNRLIQRNVHDFNSLLLVLSLLLGSSLLYLVWQVGVQFDCLISQDRIVGVMPRRISLQREQSLSKLEVMHGIAPGQIGYEGYDLAIFEGVWDETPPPEHTGEPVELQ